MSGQKKAYLELHIAVLLFGITAILGDLINLPAALIVWWRVLITSISFLFLIDSLRTVSDFDAKERWIFSGIGVITGLHWVFFFAAVRYSNASITLVAMACTSFFASLLEPMIIGRKIEKLELILGIVIVPAMLLIVNTIEIEFRVGIFFGLISAFLAALFTSLNKRYLIKGREKEISFLELGSAWVFLTCLLPFYYWKQPLSGFWPSSQDWIYLLVLSLLCTTLAYLLALRALNHISAFASTLTINLEPVYGILLAIVLLKEYKELNSEFYIGVLVIISAVTIYPLIMKRRKRKLL